MGAAPGGGSSPARRVLRRGPGGDRDPRTKERFGGGGGGGVMRDEGSLSTAPRRPLVGRSGAPRRWVPLQRPRQLRLAAADPLPAKE